ncbi:hypothetical protein ERUR111494_07790 [Erysipelothrix urinaevulpis]
MNISEMINKKAFELIENDKVEIIVDDKNETRGIVKDDQDYNVTIDYIELEDYCSCGSLAMCVHKTAIILMKELEDPEEFTQENYEDLMSQIIKTSETLNREDLINFIALLSSDNPGVLDILEMYAEELTQSKYDGNYSIAEKMLKLFNDEYVDELNESPYIPDSFVYLIHDWFNEITNYADYNQEIFFGEFRQLLEFIVLLPTLNDFFDQIALNPIKSMLLEFVQKYKDQDDLVENYEFVILYMDAINQTILENPKGNKVSETILLEVVDQICKQSEHDGYMMSLINHCINYKERKLLKEKEKNTELYLEKILEYSNLVNDDNILEVIYRMFPSSPTILYHRIRFDMMSNNDQLKMIKKILHHDLDPSHKKAIVNRQIAILIEEKSYEKVVNEINKSSSYIFVNPFTLARFKEQLPELYFSKVEEALVNEMEYQEKLEYLMKNNKSKFKKELLNNTSIKILDLYWDEITTLESNGLSKMLLNTLDFEVSKGGGTVKYKEVLTYFDQIKSLNLEDDIEFILCKKWKDEYENRPTLMKLVNERMK